MEKQVIQPAPKKCRKNERGAALVTVLMISLLLLVVAAALLLEASMNTANVTDATAEEQAYYAAESGIQTVVNVLRGNTVLPDSLRYDTTKPATHPNNQIDYIKAVRRSTSNTDGDLGCDVVADPLCKQGSRLSRWLTYSNAYPDRVILGSANSTAGYTPQNGLAYKVSIVNPDYVDDKIGYFTSGTINKQTTIWKNIGNTLTIQYVEKTVSDLDIASGKADTDFGKFVIIGSGEVKARIRFAIDVTLSKPYNGVVKTIRGFIEPGMVTPTSVGNVRIFYDSEVFELSGSYITLTGGIPIDEPFRVGYEVTPNAPNVNLGATEIKGNMTTPQPNRLVIRSTGFGPRGAKKELEAVILKDYLDGLTAPASLLLVGPAAGSVFNPGNSSAITYSGKDVHRKAFLPPVGTTNDNNLTNVNNQLKEFKGDFIGTASDVSSEMPYWLQSPTNMNSKLLELRGIADASKRLFSSSSPPTTVGDPVKGTGITYVEGDFAMNFSGGGILIVTGKLTFKGGVDFKGMIIVTGAGGFERDGGGNGTLQGNIVVAPYDPTNLSGGFLPPKYDINGGGTSEVIYNSNSVDLGLNAISNFVKGVAEK